MDYSVSLASSGGEALESVGVERPDCVVLDVLLPGMTGYSVCQELRRLHGDALPIIFVSGERTEPADRVAGLLLGADDYIALPFDPDEFLARVRRAVERWSQAVHAETDSPGLRELTAREREVLALLAEGRDQAAIAEDLFISTTTVSTHIQRVLSKLGVHSRAQAVAVAHLEHLVDGRGPSPENGGPRSHPSEGADGRDARGHGVGPQSSDQTDHWWLDPTTARVRVAAASGVLSAASEEWAELMQRKPEEVIGRHFMDFLMPDARPAASEFFDFVRRAGEARGLAELRRGDGAPLTIEFHAVVNGDSIDVALRPVLSEGASPTVRVVPLRDPAARPPMPAEGPLPTPELVRSVRD